MEGKRGRRFGMRLGVLGLSTLLAAGVAGSAVHAQHPIFQRNRGTVCPPPTICPPVAPPTPVEPGKKPEPPKTPETPPRPPDTAPPLSFEGGPAVRGESFAYGTPNLQGDQLGIPAIAFGRRGSPQFPPSPGQVSSAVVVPSVRSFKIAENDSPFPRDRVYFGFNYYADVNKAVNRHFGSDLESLRVYRATFGVEKTFLDGDVSVGLRLPVNTLNADSRVPGLGGDSTSAGDLSVILKAALWGQPEQNRLVAAGLAVTAPTGPSRFAGFDNISPGVHSTVLQPFVGGVCGHGDFFVHGFAALDVPTNSDDVTMWYTDIGLGWFLYRKEMATGFLTAVVPTLEVHVNSPLNHRGVLRSTDPAGTPDVIALTAGTTFEINRRATFAVGFVTPLSGPRPFDWEVLAQLNIRFGDAGGRLNVLGQ
jgi:hypothetical protein